MRSLTFAKRNILELIRDPLSSIFFVVFPGALYVILSLIMKSLGAEALMNTPQFEINHLTMSMIVFSFSFITIFVGNMIANDKESFFLMRLKSTPMRAKDFIIGYTIAIIPIALFQEIFMLIIGMILGLTINGYIFLAALFLFPMSFLFIGFGILFGTLVNSKAVGGLSSIIPTMTSLLGGMFFPLDNMEGGFKTICYIFPFANATKVSNLIIQGNFNVWLPYLIVLAYVIVIYGISIFILNYKLSHDGI